MVSMPAWRNRLIAKHMISRQITEGKHYTDYTTQGHPIRCMVVLECGHKLDKLASDLEGAIEVDCRACGIERSNAWIKANPEEAELLRTGGLHPDGRPKPKFRSAKKQEKFLKKAAARHNAVFEPGQPATIEDDANTSLRSLGNAYYQTEDD